jgi:hypothetical protein
MQQVLTNLSCLSIPSDYGGHLLTSNIFPHCAQDLASHPFVAASATPSDVSDRFSDRHFE